MDIFPIFSFNILFPILEITQVESKVEFNTTIFFHRDKELDYYLFKVIILGFGFEIMYQGTY